MEPKTIEALKWIVGILNKLEVPYRIGGGFAAHVYGAKRPINDIDISLPGKFFAAIVPEVKGYVTAGPKHYSNEKWDCDTLSLNYHGQEIDMTDIDTLRMSNKAKTEWFQTKDRYRQFPNVVANVEGIDVSLIDPRDLAAYKKELADADHQHQLVDIAAAEEYIRSKNLA